MLSALHVYFRDVRYLVQAALLVWIYLTPVIYPLGRHRRRTPFVVANPMTGVVELYRAATVGAESGLGTRPLVVDGGWCRRRWPWSASPLHRRFDRVFVDLL